MSTTERTIHTQNERAYPNLNTEGVRNLPFTLSYTTRPDTDNGIFSRNLNLDFREGSFSLKSELSVPLQALCDTLKIQAPHSDQDIPNFVKQCLYTVDEETSEEKPHFENEVIPILFPNGDLEALKVKKFLATSVAPEKADQCCEIKGTMDSKKESVHLHGPYQADNKTGLTLLALVGYKPAQELLSKLVEKQPDFLGKPLEQTVLAVSMAIVERKSHQEIEHNDSDREHHQEHEHHEPVQTTAKPLEKFTLTEIIPSHELGVWGQSLKTVTDATLGLVLMQDQMGAKTKKVLENTVSYRLGFSPDPRRLLPEEVMLNRACDDAIAEHLKQEQELIKGLPAEQLAQALLLMRSVQFREEQMHQLTETLKSINPDELKQSGTLEELQPTLDYRLKLGGKDTNFSYSQILQVISLSMSLQAQKEEKPFSTDEERIMQLSSMFSEFGFTLSNFRSDANPYIQEHPYLLKPGQPLQGFEQAAARNNPNALQAFKGVDAHSRGKDIMGLHGTIKMENGKLVQDLCPDHTQQVTEQLQQVEEMTQQLTQQFMQAKMEMPIPPIQQPLQAPLYPPPYLYGAPNQLGGLPPFHNSQMGHPYGNSFMSEVITEHSSTFGSRNESSRSVNNKGNRGNRAPDSDRSGLGPESQNNRGSSEERRNNPSPDANSPKPISINIPRPRPSEPERKLFIQEVTSGGKSPSVHESIATTKRPEDASGRVFITRDNDHKHSAQPALTLVREVQSGGVERSSINTSTTIAPEQAARVAYVNRANSAPLTLLRDIPSGGVDRSALRATPVTSEPARAARVTYINSPDSGQLTFIQPVRAGGKPKDSVANVRKTTNASQAARTEYVNVGVARTFVREVNSGGVDSTSVSLPKTDNPSEATSVSYVNSESSRNSGPSNSDRPASQSVPSLQPSRSESSQKPRAVDNQPVSNNLNRSIESSTPRFTTSTIDTGPRNPSPTKPNPNRSLNSGESISTPVSKPAKAPNIVIGSNLTKAFDQVQQIVEEKATATPTQVVKKTEQVAETVQSIQNKQQEQVATALGGTGQEKTQQNASKKVETGESFGTSVSNETVAQSIATQKIKEKTETTSPAATQTRQSRGSSNVTEAARITELETPKGKVKIIEGGRTTSVSGNAPQRTQSASGSSVEEAVVATVKGTDEQHEENQTSDTQTSAQKHKAKPVASVNNVVKVKQSGQTAAASLSLSVNNEYLDFTNPHGIGDAFKQAWSQALAA